VSVLRRRGNVKRLVIAATAAMLVAAIGVLAPAGPAQAAADIYLYSEDSGFLGYTWDFCADVKPPTTYIFLEGGPGLCGAADANVMGRALITTNSFTSHIVDVCNYGNTVDSDGPFGLRVEAANQDGSSTGYVVEYKVDPGHCYRATKGYPMRKFRATWTRFTEYASGWHAVPVA
jgi:hypothetical protein